MQKTSDLFEDIRRAVAALPGPPVLRRATDEELCVLYGWTPAELAEMRTWEGDSRPVALDAICAWPT